MYLLDSCICIDFMRGKLPTGYEVMRNSDPQLFGIPTIVEAELHTGVLKSKKPRTNRLLLESFLAPFHIIPFDSRCAIEYARIRASIEAAGQKIGPNDTLIAATAIAHGAVLVTNNTREFKRIEGLDLESWHEIEL